MKLRPHLFVAAALAMAASAYAGTISINFGADRASLATATWAMVHGARMVRAHDVSVTAQAATIVSGGFPVS